MAVGVFFSFLVYLFFARFFGIFSLLLTTAPPSLATAHPASLSRRSPVDASRVNRLEYFVWVHYMSKFLDYFDTVFIIMRGKEKQQLSFLHVYHHASIGMIWGALLYMGHGNGTAGFGALINSVSHCIAFTHTTFGRQILFTHGKMLVTHGKTLFTGDSLHHVLTLPVDVNWVQQPFLYI